MRDNQGGENQIKDHGRETVGGGKETVGTTGEGLSPTERPFGDLSETRGGGTENAKICQLLSKKSQIENNNDGRNRWGAKKKKGKRNGSP